MNKVHVAATELQQLLKQNINLERQPYIEAAIRLSAVPK